MSNALSTLSPGRIDGQSDTVDLSTFNQVDRLELDFVASVYGALRFVSAVLYDVAQLEVGIGIDMKK